MGERFKYAKNGICQFENFAEHLTAEYFSRVYLGKLCGMKWYSELRINDNGKEIFPVIYSDNENPEVEHSVLIDYKLNHSKQNKNKFKMIKKEVLKSDEASRGFDAPILEILNVENGWLNDGTLSLEYGIRVEAIFENNIWTFNFNDKQFNEGGKMIKFGWKNGPNTVEPLYAHRLLLSFHSTNLEDYSKFKWICEQYRRPLMDLLQICHGVRLNLDEKYKTSQILQDAFNLKMFNVVSYCDWYSVQIKSWERLKGHGNAWILIAIEFNMRHLLAFMMKSMTSLKEVVGEEDVEKMSNESMKMFVAKFLYEKF